MEQTEHETEEVTTIEPSSPHHREVRSKKTVEPAVRTAHPQQVFEEKKTIFRFNQVIWYILGVIEVLLGFRVVLKAIGADPFSGFAHFIYAVTAPLVAPFFGVVGISATTSGAVFEWPTLIAAAVYVCIAWGLIYLLDLAYPITPEDVAA